MIACTNCRRFYPETGLPYRCPICGGLYDYDSLWPFDPSLVEGAQPGLWRYRHTFGLPADLEPVSLGEGQTPLRAARAFGRKIYFKCEHQNPTGSFKDRGSAVIAGWLKARRVAEVVEDSSGNAGASLAAYATHAGVRARIFVPETASGPKRRQIEDSGADLVLVAGPRSEAAEAVRREAERGVVYASHAWLPFNLPGYATAAYEIFEQLGGRLPGAVVVPAGQGGLLLGLARGFEGLRVANIENQKARESARNAKAGVRMTAQKTRQPLWKKEREVCLPKLIAVQARACAPLWTMFHAGREGLGFVAEVPTLAEGVQVRQPVRGEAVLRALAASSGSVCAVDEAAVLPGWAALARLGFDVEPTSAIVWDALRQTLAGLPDPVVVLLTGAGWKSG